MICLKKKYKSLVQLGEPVKKLHIGNSVCLAGWSEIDVAPGVDSVLHQPSREIYTGEICYSINILVA